MISKSSLRDKSPFQPPPLLTRDEYAFFKQVLTADPDFSLLSSVRVWSVYPYAGWLLAFTGLASLCGIFFHALFYSAAGGVLLLAIYFFGRKERRLSDFMKTQASRNRYFAQLKQIIIEAADYEDYLRRIVRI